MSNPQTPIFNYKAVIIVGIGLIIACIITSIIITPVHAGEDKDRCNFYTNSSTECYNMIMDQNEQIIDKLDWNNCGVKYKASHSYSTNWGKNDIAFNFDDLVRICGEMP